MSKPNAVAHVGAPLSNDSLLSTFKDTDELRISPDKEMTIAELSAAHVA